MLVHISGSYCSTKIPCNEHFVFIFLLDITLTTLSYTATYSLIQTPAWHLDYVEVIDETTGDHKFFPSNQWFDRSQGDGLIERTLEASFNGKHGDGVKEVYKVTVYTSDVKFAGTDADVSIQLFGNG